MTFRSMNRYAETQVMARTISRNKSPELTPSGSTARGEILVVQLEKSSIPKGMDTDWRAVAIPRFFGDHGKSTHPVYDSSFCFMKEVLEQNSSETYFRDAVEAAAFINLANQIGQAWLEVEGRQAYGRAIRGSAMALQTPSKAKDDALLASTILFGFVEVPIQVILTRKPGNET